MFDYITTHIGWADSRELNYTFDFKESCLSFDTKRKAYQTKSLKNLLDEYHINDLGELRMTHSMDPDLGMTPCDEFIDFTGTVNFGTIYSRKNIIGDEFINIDYNAVFLRGKLQEIYVKKIEEIRYGQRSLVLNNPSLDDLDWFTKDIQRVKYKEITIGFNESDQSIQDALNKFLRQTLDQNINVFIGPFEVKKGTYV